MKQIKNWKSATVFDIEADSLLDEATMFHVLSFHMANDKVGSIDGDDHDRFRRFLNYHLDNELPLVAHNGILFDVALCEKLLGVDLTNLMVIDTLAISWYINTKRDMHGLDSFLEDYGIEKPKVGEAEWVKPIKGIKLSIRVEGKGKERQKIVTYHKIVDPLEPSEEYIKKGLVLEQEDMEEISLLESEEDYLSRVKAHKELMIFRCGEDVKINVALWKDMMVRLHEMYSVTKQCIDEGLVNPKRISSDETTYLDRYVGASTVDEYVERCLTFLMFKLDCARLQEKTRWKADVEYYRETEKDLAEKNEIAKEALESIMPPVAKYKDQKKPSGDPNKKDGTPKAVTLRWNEAVAQIDDIDHLGNPMVKRVDGKDDVVKIIKGYENPNANSSDQLKKMFFSFGWKPETFKFVKDAEAMEKWVKGGFKKSEKPVPRMIPQISKDGDDGKELCPSILRLAEEVPEILKYDSYTTIKHRLDTVKGFLRDMTSDGYLKARIGGFTNCLTADSVIVTSRGSLLIGEVRIGDQVLTHVGTYADVIDTIDNGIKDVFRVRMEDGHEIKCTYNHKFWDGSNWIMAQDLVKGKEVKVYGDVESWKEIDRSVGYKISSWGRIMNPTGSIKTIDKVGGNVTFSVELEWKDGVRRCSIISRLVMEAFCGNSDLHVLHKDGNPYNNNIQNLKYGTDAENMSDTKIHGKHVKGVRNKINNKLDHNKVVEIKELSAKGYTGKKLAEMFNVSQSMISFTLNDKRWSDRLNEENNYVEDFSVGKVESVTLVSTEPTFDISVSGVHSYVANGFVVHNTLRVKHRELVNLIGVDKPYGENVRGGLTCLEGEILMGSDLSSLEDRVKHHFMLPHDPEYVATMMADDYDPHILTAHSAGMVTDLELKGFKEGTLTGEIKEAVSKARKGGKCTNYACVPSDISKVKTLEGFVWIDEVQEGDVVLGFNDVLKQYCETTVTKVERLLKSNLVEVFFDEESFIVTKEHAWLTPDGFKHSDDLVIGEVISDGHILLEYKGMVELPFTRDTICLSTDTNTFILKQYGEEILTGNCVYGGSPDAIARSAGIDVHLAKQLHEGYWKLNWSVKAIAEEQCVFEDSHKQKWLINPINGIAYSLRTEKDRFSTLCQGTGSYFFDIWVDNMLTEMQRLFKTKKLTGSFHR